MSEMLERVTEAIWDASHDSFGGVEVIVPRIAAARLARVAIAAMREPTEAMVDASREEGVHYNDDARGYVANEWRAMIDAAIAEPAE